MSEEKKIEMFELSDDQVEQIAGGDGANGGDGDDDFKRPDCPKCGCDNAFYIQKTGKRREGSLFGWIDDKQYYCKNCGTYFWDWGKQDWE